MTLRNLTKPSQPDSVDANLNSYGGIQRVFVRSLCLCLPRTCTTPCADCHRPLPGQQPGRRKAPGLRSKLPTASSSLTPFALNHLSPCLMPGTRKGFKKSKPRGPAWLMGRGSGYSARHPHGPLAVTFAPGEHLRDRGVNLRHGSNRLTRNKGGELMRGRFIHLMKFTAILTALLVAPEWPVGVGAE